jgi:hypothetical protein
MLEHHVPLVNVVVSLDIVEQQLFIVQPDVSLTMVTAGMNQVSQRV